MAYCSDYAKYMDHTLLKCYATQEMVKTFCEEALEYKFASVCVNATHIPLVSSLLKGSGVKTCCVVGFPLGATTTLVKTVETIEAIKNKNPDVEIIVLATTYLTRDKSYSNLNNKNLSLLNSYMLEYCNANGMDFIDVASPLRDGDGYLADVYSSDSYCHLTAEAYYIWMDILRDYATQKTQGTWVNPTSIPLFE